MEGLLRDMQIPHAENKVEKVLHPYPGARFENEVSRFAITIGRPIKDVYAFWSNFENLSLFMKHIKQVEVFYGNKSRWLAQIKSGLSFEWDVEIIEDRKNEMISWQSVKNLEAETTGTVWFKPAPAGRGTVVSLVMDYKSPEGKISEFLAQFTGDDVDSLIQTNLHRLKCYLETGEIATTEGQPSGREEITTHH